MANVMNRQSIYEQSPWLARRQPQRRWLRGKFYLVAKRLMDITLVVLSFPLTLPVMALVALAIWIEEPWTPVLFTQRRTGKGGHLFGMYKFRTMVVNAEEMKKQLAHLNELQWPDFKITNDPRITRVGRILRKTSLDELPQLLNVLKGDMSLVGPRPTSFKPETYQLWQTERLDVQPGLTGLWQIVGRSETEFDERLRLDIAYIERRGLLVDLEILFRTVLAVVKGRGAR